MAYSKFLINFEAIILTGKSIDSREDDATIVNTKEYINNIKQVESDLANLWQEMNKAITGNNEIALKINVNTIEVL